MGIKVKALHTSLGGYSCLGYQWEEPVKWGKGTVTRAQAGTLPRPIWEWFGFDGDNPGIMLKNGNIVSATQANDGLGLNFEQIADAFERAYVPEDVKNG